MLVSFARELGTAFNPYVEVVLKLALSHLTFIFHDGVRSAAAEIMPCLIGCVKDQGVQAERAILDQVLPALIESLNNESDLEVLADKLHAFAQLVESCGVRLLSADDLAQICAVVQSQMGRYEERLVEIRKSRKDEELDEDDQAEMEDVYELESSVLGRISDIVHFLFVTLQEQFLPYFAPMNTKFAALVTQGRAWRDRQWGQCIYDDVIEYGGCEGRRAYQQVYLEPMLRHIGDEYPEVRQAAAYGMGVLAMKGGDEYAQTCARALPLLAAAINMPNARDTEEGVEAAENAVSAVAKVLKHNQSAFNANEVLPSFLTWLPIWEDAEELPHVYDYFCDLIEQNHPLVLGENNSGLSRVFEIIVHTFARGAFDIDEPKEHLVAVKQRLINIVKMLHVSGDDGGVASAARDARFQSNQEIFQHILGSVRLNNYQQGVLQAILGS